MYIRMYVYVYICLYIYIYNTYTDTSAGAPDVFCCSTRLPLVAAPDALACQLPL